MKFRMFTNRDGGKVAVNVDQVKFVEGIADNKTVSGSCNSKVRGFDVKMLRIENNYTPTGESEHCKYWEGFKGFHNVPDKCRYCKFRPLYTDRCEIEDCLPVLRSAK